MVRIDALRKDAIKLMIENNIEEARIDTDVLLEFFLNVSKSDILLGEKLAEKEDAEKFMLGIKRRIEGEPVQYITGKTEFMSMNFFVDKNTLIPRADTEILVEECIRLIKEKNIKTVLDIGAGSGAIGLSLAYYCKDIKVTLLDISKEALFICKKNADANSLTDRISFAEKDIMKVKEEELSKYDLIVSNPPYIEEDVFETLDEKVKKFEPYQALVGGSDGLDFYKVITKLSSKKAKYLAFEIGYNQKDQVENIMKRYFKDIIFLKDYGKNPRCLLGKNIQI